jgi:predicted outer membrane repeat protein
VRREVFLLIVILASVCAADTITVNLDGSGDYTSIQAAIEAAIDSDEVVVADGTYTGDGNRDIDFLGKAITVRSENGPDTCIIDCQGSEEEPHRAFIFQNAEDPNSILDGFTVTNGVSAVFCRKSSPVFRNCVFNNNIAYYSGGGAIHNIKGSPIIDTCSFIQNSSLYFSAWPGMGGAICNDAGFPCIRNCVFLNNYSQNFGGAIFSGSVSIGDIAEFNFDKMLVLDNCSFSGNCASVGGAICNHEIKFLQQHDPVASKLNVSNSTFTGNMAYEGGGLRNFCSWSSGVSVTNSILWANIAAEGTDEHAQISGRISTNYSCVQGWTGDLGGIGNMGEDPLFIDPGCWDDNGTPDVWYDDFWIEGDFHLQEGSPCIDTGDPNYIAEPDETDLDGNPRILDGNSDGTLRIDMGAYEYAPPVIVVPVDVKITPNVLNVNSNGQFAVAHITLPEDLLISADDIETALLQDQIEAVWIELSENDEGLLTIKFERSAVNDFLIDEGLTGEVELSVTVELDDGTILKGADIVRVMNEI